MEALRYSVIEKSSNNEQIEKDFGIYKDDALNYFESRCKEIDDELSNWKKELGFNSCIWSKEKEFKLIYIQIDGHENLEIEIK